MNELAATWSVGALVVLAGYLLGSISFSTLIVRWLVGIDIRTVGSGNPGATNVMRAAGRGPALAAFVLDAGKGAAGVALARWLELGVAAGVLAGGAAVVGHLWPVFFKFRGGKGVATAAGTLGMLVPLATALSLVLFVATVWWKRYVSLGSVVVAIACPLFVAGLGAAGHYPVEARWWLTGGCAVIGALIVLKHRPNLERLAQGTESKLGERGPALDGSSGEDG